MHNESFYICRSSIIKKILHLGSFDASLCFPSAPFIHSDRRILSGLHLIFSLAVFANGLLFPELGICGFH